MREFINKDATTSEVAEPIYGTIETRENANSQNLDAARDVREMMRKLINKRRPLAPITKEICKTGQPRELSARFVRNQLGHARFGKENTKEMVSRLYCFHGVICIFMDGNRLINLDPNGNPVESINQNYSVILKPIKRK